MHNEIKNLFNDTNIRLLENIIVCVKYLMKRIDHPIFERFFLLLINIMQNYIKIKDKVFKAQLIWRNNKNDNTKDDDDKIFPFPKEDKEWSMSKSLLERLKKIS